MKNIAIRLLPRGQKHGFVLILVLGILVLITILVVGFFSHTITQTKMAANYGGETNALVLSDVAVNLVKAQIDDATSHSASIWASQPGAIRVYNNDGSGAIYKLYSSPTLTISDPNAPVATGSNITPGNPIANDLPNDNNNTTALSGTDWATSSLWTDLNAPVMRTDGINAYPIIDAYNDPGDLPGMNLTAANAPPPSFTINLPNSIGVQALSKTTPATPYPVPMPVQWLYVLKGGQVISPDPSSSLSTTGSATFSKANPVPTTANPIVGRIAYWTDDDSSRVNINTASQGTFWATPAFTAPDDIKLATNQPSENEYQRYSGHPATTSLALALPEFADNSGNVSVANLQNIINLTPRYGPTAGTTAGSQGGTVVSNTNAVVTNTNRLYSSVNELLFNPPNSPNTTGAPVPRTATAPANTSLTRQQVETAKFFLTAHSRAPELNLYGQPRVAIWPESLLNSSLYRTPTDQVIAFCSTLNGTSPAFTGTAALPYYFSRYPYTPFSADSPPPSAFGCYSNAAEANIFRNAQLLQYLDYLTGGTQIDYTKQLESAQMVTNGIGINATAAHLPLPGYLAGSNGNAANFNSKYSNGGGTDPIGMAGMRQILTEIFDYIRSTNIRDAALDAQFLNAPAGSMPYAARNAYEWGQIVAGAGEGQVAPTELVGPLAKVNAPSALNWNTYGFGRYPGRIVEVSIVFVGVGQGVLTGTNAVAPAPVYSGTGTNVYPVMPYSAAGIFGNGFYAAAGNLAPGCAAPGTPPANQTAVQAFFCVSFFDPAVGYSRETPYIFIGTNGLQNLTVTSPTQGVTKLFNGEVYERMGTMSAWVTAYDTFEAANPGVLGGLMDFRWMLSGRSYQKEWDNYDPISGYIFNEPNRWGSSLIQSGSLATTGTMQFNGGSFNITMYGPEYNNDAAQGPSVRPLLHNYMITFPPASIPTPGYSLRPLFGALFSDDWATSNINGKAGATGYTNPPTSDFTGGNTTDRFFCARCGNLPASGTDYLASMIDSKNDTVISMVPAPNYSDYRMLCAPATAANAWVPLYKPVVTGTTASGGVITGYWSPTLSGSSTLFYGLRYNSGQALPSAQMGNLVPAVSGTTYYMPPNSSPLPLNQNYGSRPFVPVTDQGMYAGGVVIGGAPPDFDNGFGEMPDGPYINRPDEGAVYSATAAATSTATVYFDNLATEVDTLQIPTFFFSPQRQVASPVAFGSLPTGAPLVSDTLGDLLATGYTPKPWQTLLFQPGAPGHFGLKAPKDEYLLDLFWMPQALPYAMSEPFSTAGKVNLNYQIFPFTYINRSTAIQSVLATEEVAQVGAADAKTYKNYSGGGASMTRNARSPLNLSGTTGNGTLGWFEKKFYNDWSVFKTAAEICDVVLVPQGQSWSVTSGTAQYYGPNFALVGSNTRDKPYDDIYSRVTTKSNTFTVYYRVQTLKNPGNHPTTWSESNGAITGEFRGSTTIERYIDPNKPVNDYASNPNPSSLDSPSTYAWRVVENDRFAP